MSLWDKNKDEFYYRYLADNRPPRFPQTQPMAIGSAFDAYVKSYLHERLFGKDNDPKFQLSAIFEAQVDEQHRDWALSNGKYVFEQYKQAGCLGDLMGELLKASSDPRFEFEVKGAVNGYREGVETDIAGVVLLGKPDVHYVNHAGVTVILDFKVNGYCSKSGASPLSGYIRMRSAGNTAHKQHKDCTPMNHLGMLINVAKYLEDQEKSWAQQLAIYGWLTGCPVGSEFLVAIDQVACAPTVGGLPAIRFAEHRTRVGSNFQFGIFNKAAEIWETVHSDHIFRDKTKKASADHCASLDRRSSELGGEGTPENVWFAEMSREVSQW